MQPFIKKDSFEKKEQNELKLNEEELNTLEGFNGLTPSEKENLKDLVFNLSLVLYKSFKNEPA
jgi:hypothetical protein